MISKEERKEVERMYDREAQKRINKATEEKNWKKLIVRGASIPLIPDGGNGDTEIFLKKVLREGEWCLGNGGNILYVEQKSFTETVNLLKESGYLLEN